MNTLSRFYCYYVHRVDEDALQCRTEQDGTSPTGIEGNEVCNTPTEEEKRLLFKHS